MYGYLAWKYYDAAKDSDEFFDEMEPRFVMQLAEMPDIKLHWGGICNVLYLARGTAPGHQDFWMAVMEDG